MSEYFPNSKSLGPYVENPLDSCNYVTKADLKNVTSIDTSDFA